MEAPPSLAQVCTFDCEMGVWATCNRMRLTFLISFAGDETLRFWQIFPGPRSGEKDGSGGLLFPNTLGSVIR